MVGRINEGLFKVLIKDNFWASFLEGGSGWLLSERSSNIKGMDIKGRERRRQRA